MKMGTKPLRIEDKIIEALLKVLKDTLDKTQVDSLGDIEVEPTRNRSFGDISTNLAMKLASLEKKNPQEIANSLIVKLNKIESLKSEVEKIESKGGFINFFIKEQNLYNILKEIQASRDNYGKDTLGKAKKVLLEFVSANPTGPLSIAHARQAAVGDSLANILESLGCKVTREYYLNDEGNQINLLGKSILSRCKELLGESGQFPEDGYQGEYIYDIAKKILAQKKNKIEKLDLDYFSKYGVDHILDGIKIDLADLGVKFDDWFPQSGITKKIDKTLADLRKKGLIYDKDGAVWFKSTQFGDDKDRVVVKSDKSYTYLAPDIAYHDDKFKRGFNWSINIWGPDHHGYISRLTAAVQALGFSKEAISVLIVQLATLTKNGKPISMSTRRGEYVTMRELIDEVGKDAARFFLLMRRLDSHLDFDLELAKKHSNENPVYYIQYAHARISSILNSSKIDIKKFDDKILTLLNKKEEIDILRHMRNFEAVLQICFRNLDPFALIPYLQELASLFHKFYDTNRVLVEDEQLKKARLILIDSIKIALANGLKILGVSRPEKM